MVRKSQKAGSPAYRYHGSSGLLSGKSLDVIKMPLTKFETDYSKQLLSTTGGGVKKRLKKSLKKKRKPSKKRKSKKVEEAGNGNRENWIYGARPTKGPFFSKKGPFFSKKDVKNKYYKSKGFY